MQDKLKDKEWKRQQKKKLQQTLQKLIAQWKLKERFWEGWKYYFPALATVYNNRVYYLEVNEDSCLDPPDLTDFFIYSGKEFSGTIPEAGYCYGVLVYTPGIISREYFCGDRNINAEGDLAYVVKNWKYLDWRIISSKGEAEFVEEHLFQIADILIDLFGEQFLVNVYDKERERSRESKDREEK